MDWWPRICPVSGAMPAVTQRRERERHRQLGLLSSRATHERATVAAWACHCEQLRVHTWRSGVKGDGTRWSKQAGRAPLTLFVDRNSFFFSLVLPIPCRNLINFINKSCSSISDLHLCLKFQPQKIKGFEDLEF
jgi:hypothetical protein